ncbi:hypothetical protein ABTK05_21495, partial [Acinetobacter baumannii]
VSIPELTSNRVGTAQLLAAESSVALSSRQPDRTVAVTLTGGMADYDWGIDGRRFDMNQPLDGAHEIREGERVRLAITNDTE